jgi:tRNA dimethylallyltransferase
MAGQQKKIIVITGATASGKTSLAVELALRFGGEIISADSMQVYRGMDIGTAKPTLAERRGVPHHLLDVVDPDEPFDAGRYRDIVIPLVEKIRKRGAPCFLVGGTGLYIKALLGGLLPTPPSHRSIRKRLNEIWDEDDGVALNQRLKSIDPQGAESIHPHDRVRIIRALEVFELTGKPFSVLVRRHAFKKRSFEALKICLQLDRDRLYDRINQRCLHMVELGLLRETEDLLERGYSSDLKPMKAIGYRHMVCHISGQWGLDKTISTLQRDTRRYAKRQITWFRADPEITYFNPMVESQSGLIRSIDTFVSS